MTRIEREYDIQENINIIKMFKDDLSVNKIDLVKGIQDIQIVKRLYGASPEHPGWVRQSSRCFTTPHETAQAELDA